MLDAKAREALEGVSRLAGRLVAKTGLTPNAITVGGVLITAGAAWLVVEEQLVTAGVVLVVGGVLDFLDGAVARETGRITKLGAFMDSMADRFSDVIILSAVVWLAFDRRNVVFASLALAALALALLTSYVRAKAESLGYSCKVGIVERAERVVVLIAGLLFGILEIAVGVLVAGSTVTVVQRLVHVGKQAHADR